MKQMTVVAAGLVTSMLLTACGGGGGGDDGNNSANNTTYNGATQPASITPQTAAKLTGLILTAADADLPQMPNVDAVTSTVQNKLGLLPGVSESGSGNCGGSYTVSETDTTFSMSFNNFCYEEGSEFRMYIDGAMQGMETSNTFSYSFDEFTMTINNNSMYWDGAMSGEMDEYGYGYVTLDDLTYTIDGYTEAFDGTFSVSANGIYLDYTYNENGTIYKAENFEVKTDYTGENVTHVSGKIYDPVDGYVEISMVEDFSYSQSCSYPVTGVMRLTGADSAYADIWADTGDCNTYQVCIDGTCQDYDWE